MVDVQRLMQDLTVEQLVQIQSSFDNEIENKKEELRQMVGRRYRDVLEASNTVKRLTEIANELVSELNDVGNASSMTEKTSATLASDKAKPSSAAHTFFVVLNSLLPQIGSTNDSLSDVFCLLLAESFHRRFSTSVEAGGISSISNSLSQTIFNQLLVSRLELADKLLNELGWQTDWQIVAGHLSALALLKQLPVDALLDAYLQSRTDTIFLSLKSSNTSLIGIIRMIKSTTQVIDAVFGQGEAIISALKTVTQPGWCPETVSTIIEDQLYCYAKLFTDEIPKVNASYAKSATYRPIVPMTISDVERKCSDWVDKMCSLSSERVRAMCDFENSQQLVEFVAAISQLFRSDWPSIASNLSIYQRLFGNSIADRFRFLIDNELSTLEINLISEVTKVNCNPMPLFQKRAVKFDALLASGVSHELNDLVQKMFDGMKQLLNNVNKYVTMGREQDNSDGSASELLDALADAVLELVNRLLAHFKISLPTETTTSRTVNAPDACEDRSMCLTAFRLFLSFVQHEPSIFCQCMNRNPDKIVHCNRTLHLATEAALCRYMDFIVDDCVQSSQLAEMPQKCTAYNLWFDLVQVPEKVELNEGTSVDVPTQLSRYYFHFLYAVCRHINNQSLGHLFTRNVIDYISKKLGEILSGNLKKCAEECCHAPIICTQLLFDCRALFLMFPVNKGFVEAAETLQAKIDPFELKLLSTPLSRNTKLFAARSTMIFGQLQVEPITGANSKDSGNVGGSYAALVDITPKVGDIRRLTLIPRLSKLRGGDEEKGQKGRYAGPNDTQNRPASATLSANKPGASGPGGSTSSFSSLLYDKISTAGWFKS